ncbi:MAG: hypothetical protein C6P37_09815 [Caldibacillus debilis]|uniref:Uncharacterized protein n=1 Tax=Caldibacillus debilis TaxID=301148 RepID=A0A3E0K3X3_9BACI|nr:MAG: hypothetical protein C6W57_09335 [Caldibacillus debilis]REJ28128.1 MAG: hypothetical protein C6P37_09815 [Caldibacillus debilis]
MTVFAKRMGSSFETISRFAAPGEPKFPGKKLLLVQHRFQVANRDHAGPKPAACFRSSGGSRVFRTKRHASGKPFNESFY